MNILTNHRKLLNAFRIVEKIVSKNVSLPILNTVLLKTENNKLKLSATNLELGINYWINAKIIKEGSITVPARIFSDFVSNVSDEKVELLSVNNILSINSEHYKTQILGMDPKEFPIVPRVKKERVIKINSVNLKTGLSSVLDSTALSETRPELSGVFLNVLNNKVEFAATDSFRLSEKIIPVLSNTNESIIIPRTTVIEIIRVIDGLDSDINISISDNQLFVNSEEFELVSRLVDGKYPDYKRVIPGKFISLVRINKENFEKNVRMAGIFSSSVSDVKIKTINGSMEISAKNSDKGEIKTKLACDLKNQIFELVVNFHYLLDGLKVIPTDNVILEFTGDGSPVVLKGENLKDQTYVIMPLRN